MSIAVRDWVEEGYCDIPDEDDFFADLLIIPMYKESPSKKIYIVEKKIIKKDYGISPDIFDGVAITFAYPVARDVGKSRIRKISQKDNRSNSELTTVRRISGTQRPVMSSVSVNISH